MIHYLDIFTRQSECGGKGKASIINEEVDCLDCLNLNKKEWLRQIGKFKGQPLINAQEGFKRTQERIKELEDAKEEIEE